MPKSVKCTQTLHIFLVLYFLVNCMLVLFSRCGYNEINIHTLLNETDGLPVDMDVWRLH